ncbi:hypothetical protein [Lysinibacillus sp. NPDC086135]|uniref:hypothetical protein n=1 Tax=Lysinibacillus sp. NPDC086135 TaxID=3364130 RepID=UPI0037F89DDF
MKEFVFNETATVYANSIEEAKKYLMDNLEINNDVEHLREEARKEDLFGALKYAFIFTEKQVNSIYEADYDKFKTWIDLEELELEDAYYCTDIRPSLGLALLPSSKAKKYDCYQEKVKSIKIPSISWWQI